MSYNPQELVANIENEEKRHYQSITDGNKVKATLETDGWKKIIGPLLDKMIKDIIGGKYFSRWSGGILSRTTREGKVEYYLGYKQALIDLHNRILAYKHQIKKSEGAIKLLEKEKKSGFKMPMEDGVYSPEKEKI